MSEFVPVALGALFGIVVSRCATPRSRIALSVLAVVAASIPATIFSGEYRVTWAYAAVDLAQSTLGFAIASLVDRLIAHRRLAR
jgi:hypothetical protein